MNTRTRTDTRTSLRRTIAAAAVITAIVATAACGTQTAPAGDIDAAVPGAARTEPSQSERARDADARRAARGYQTDSPSGAAPERREGHPTAGRRVPDSRP